MVKYQQSGLDRTFAALADPTRRAILSRIAAREVRVSELALPFDMSLPAVSKHLRVLERAGLVKKRRSGREQLCSLAAAPLGSAAEWLAAYQAFWEGQLERFAAYVESEHSTEEKGTWQQPKRSRRSGSAGSSKRRARKSSRRGRPRSK